MNRKAALLFLFITSLTILAAPDAFAQKKKKKKDKKKEKIEKLEPWEVDTLIAPIPINRQMFTGNVEKQVKKADMKDGAADGIIELEDTAVSHTVTQALLKQVPLILIHIENLPAATPQKKIQYHRSLEAMMRRLNARPLTPDNATYIKRSVTNFEELMLAREQNRVMEFVKQNDNIYTLDNSELLNEYPEAKAYVFEAVGKAKPEIMIKRLPEFARESYADPVIAAAAKIVPGTILTYATSTSALSSAVRRNKDPLVQTIVQIGTESKTPLKALPFLTEIYNKKRTIREVDAITANPKAYYKALVGLKTEGNNISEKAVDQELNLRGLELVREVNRLHDSPAPVRFKSLMDFDAEDLYFMMIGSQDEIYTSSFTWMFDRMLEKMKPLSGDQLLDKVNKSHFRTFIRMAAGYNKLSPFLSSMEEDKKSALMKEFVANLEKGDEDELEDAVDVADAFGSITDPKLIDFLKNEIKSNYERTYGANNKESEKGVIVYGLLSTIFNSADNSTELSGQLSVIPPITFVPYESLKNAKGEVIVQTFFYGDEDGRSSFASFKSNFPAAKWKVSSNKDWMTFTSIGDHPIIVYANLPLEEPKDEEAQRALQKYLTEKEIVPTMVIHRGHSYHLGGSLENLTPEVKVVMLGSCGGYHNLAQVLDKAPDANIISSKQVGSKSVNEPIIRTMFSQLLQGQDIDWINSWSELNKYFNSRGAQEKDLFSDYVPPNKNLGAIFIKAYRKMALKNDAES
ncbi:hypothetical protein [Taibaiella helva]|uniref:hypothetical protein n=1 Tax=Taibaiella helva TaxID=2301235 RepID=UPI00130027E8|nr:hypothetical protein [Taibaiella helva]